MRKCGVIQSTTERWLTSSIASLLLEKMAQALFASNEPGIGWKFSVVADCSRGVFCGIGERDLAETGILSSGACAVRRVVLRATGREVLTGAI